MIDNQLQVDPEAISFEDRAKHDFTTKNSNSQITLLTKFPRERVTRVTGTSVFQSPLYSFNKPHVSNS